MKVYKIGGSCLKDYSSLRGLDSIVEETGKKILVFSAFSGVTDSLYRIWGQGNRERIPGLMDLINWHLSLLSPRIDDSGETFLELISEFNGAGSFDEFMDSLNASDLERFLSLGEMMSAISFYIYTKNKGYSVSVVPSNILGLFVTKNGSERFVDYDRSSEMIYPKVEESFYTSECIITTGFFGYDMEGNIATLGRNSSDYSAAAIACLSGADEIIFLKDVEGIYSGDPKKSSFFTLMKDISYDDAMRISMSGSRILHPLAIEICRKNFMPMKIMKFGELLHGTIIWDKK